MENNRNDMPPAEPRQTKRSGDGDGDNSESDKAAKINKKKIKMKKMDVLSSAKHPFVHRPKITSVDKLQVCSFFRSFLPKLVWVVFCQNCMRLSLSRLGTVMYRVTKSTDSLDLCQPSCGKSRILPFFMHFCENVPHF